MKKAITLLDKAAGPQATETMMNVLDEIERRGERKGRREGERPARV